VLYHQHIYHLWEVSWEVENGQVDTTSQKGSTEKFNNYRPLSNLCVISKVLKMIVHDQVSSYCAKEDIIPKTQHGFQKGKST
jgi:hypothetical protein